MARPTLRSSLVGVPITLAILLAACNGGSDDPTATPGPGGAGTPIPTASPFAAVPAPTILDATSGGSDGGTAEDVVYVVVAGDSLSAIAEEFGTTVEDLMAANDLADANIFVGQELTIPGASGSTGGTPATPTPRPTTGAQVYVVQPGDTAFGIALEFNTTLEALAAANGISVDELTNLQLGQELQIPGS